MSSSRSPWPGLPNLNRDPREDRPAPDPDPAFRVAREEAEARLDPANAVPYDAATPPPAFAASGVWDEPVPVVPEAGGIKLRAWPRLLDGKFAIVLGPHEFEKPQNAVEGGVAQRFADYAAYHTRQAEEFIKATRRAFFRDGPGKLYLDAKARAADAAAEVAKLETEAAVAHQSWLTAVKAGADQAADEHEAEESRAVKAKERAQIRAKALADHAAELKAEIADQLHKAVVEARNRYEQPLAARLEQAKRALEEAVVLPWLRYFAVQAEHDGAVGIGGISRAAQTKWGKFLDVDNADA